MGSRMDYDRLAMMRAIIERVPENQLYMPEFQLCSLVDFSAETEKQMHACGNKACIAGWVAVSPEFQDCGGSVSLSGSPRFSALPPSDQIEPRRIMHGAHALSHWLATDRKQGLNQRTLAALEAIVLGDAPLNINLKFDEFCYELGVTWPRWGKKEALAAIDWLRKIAEEEDALGHKA